jgi:hypothetical protein
MAIRRYSSQESFLSVGWPRCPNPGGNPLQPVGLRLHIFAEIHLVDFLHWQSSGTNSPCFRTPLGLPKSDSCQLGALGTTFLPQGLYPGLLCPAKHPSQQPSLAYFRPAKSTFSGSGGIALSPTWQVQAQGPVLHKLPIQHTAWH